MSALAVTPEQSTPVAERVDMVSGGRRRSYRMVRPSDVEPGAPILLALHGSLMDADSFRQFSGGTFDDVAARDGVVVVYPDAIEGMWVDGRIDTPAKAREMGVDDVAFLAHVLEDVAARTGADTDRAYVVGFSNGGQMATTLAHVRPDLAHGVALVGATLPVAENWDVDDQRVAMPVLLVHGTEDPVVPYAGGVASLFGKARGANLSIRDTSSYWLQRNGITSRGASRFLADDGATRVRHLHWEEDGKHPVALYSVQGGGHSVPNLRVRAFKKMGATNRALDTGAVAWDFFSAAESAQR
ncbi:alpha/beta hydrolase family esterase [Nocardioides bruguierae]|uniref:Dienelactone hydrolase family protein n=1 Tax=Nocardioides bruguierae TaxID=2945102 RepID=A0A9X2D8B9_9ACTN|nr:PHB depolymerase family esterase [Nocardioides bruguierae]MCM0621210.1 dienelactone hydrolase family protein [Nocardioides bruguierae]